MRRGLAPAKLWTLVPVFRPFPLCLLGNPFSLCRAFNTAAFAQPPWYLKLFGIPFILATWVIVQIPIILLLRSMCLAPWYKKDISDYYDILEWFVTPNRIAYYVFLRIVRSVLSPDPDKVSFIA